MKRRPYWQDERVRKFFSGKKRKILHQMPDYISDYSTFTILAHPAVKSVWRDMPGASYAAFKREVFERVRKLHDLALEAKRGYVIQGFMSSSGRYISSPLFISNFFTHPRRNLSFDRQLEALRLNIRFARRWIKKPAEKVGSFTLKPWLNWHPEAPLNLVLMDVFGSIGSVGGYLYKKGGKTVLRVTNLQGVRDAGNRLKRFEREQGENWRHYLIGGLVKYAREKGLVLEGELPQKSLAGTTKGELKRQQRQYMQAFKKAGLVTGRKDKTVWRLPESE